MSFRLTWTAAALDTYDRLGEEARRSLANRMQSGRSGSSQAEGLFKQVDKTIKLLSENPRHPGLQTHEYKSIPNPFDAAKKVFEAYVQNNTPGAYRLFWCYGPKPGDLTIIAITPHP